MTLPVALASLLILHLDFNTVQMKKDAVVDCLREASRAGYNAVLWEIENKVRWETCPECVHPEAFSKDEFREILAEAERLGLEPIPLLQTFGHAEYVLCHEKYAGWRESPSFRACYCVSKPEVKSFQKALLHEYLDLFGSRVRRFHLGGDEALVFGTCEVCRQHDKMDLYVKHLQEVSGELVERGIRPGVWADMVLMGGDWKSRHKDGVSAETVRKLPTAFTLWNWDYVYGTRDGKAGNAAKTASLTGLGYEVILCAASQSFSDSPFLPRFRRHGENIAACADLVRTNALAGFCMTSWSVHLFPKSVQYPLWEFAAKRLADASVDWESVVSARWNGLPPDLVDRLSDWNGDYAKFDARIYSYEKPALPAPPGELAKRLNAMNKNGVRSRIRDRARQDLRRIESALAELRDRVKGADAVRPLETGAELNAAFLRGVIGVLDGSCGAPKLPTDATRDYYQSWQSRMSATNATALAWSLLGQEDGFVSLFNGKDLSGWEGATDTYCVSSEGYLTCTQRDGKGESGAKNLWTAKDYANFTIRFDVKLPPNANNGLGIRCPPNGWCSREGMELQLLDDWGDAYNGTNRLEAAQYTGAVYGVVPPIRKPNGESYLNKPGEWNTVEVTANGPRIVFVLNGTKIVDADVSKFSTDGTVPPDGIKRPGLHNRTGRIHWCGHGHNIFWRNIRIKELP